MHSIDLVPSHSPPLPTPLDRSLAIEAETYVYIEADDLESELWSFEDFVENNAWRWY